ncbi:MAG: hypothetical protein NC388_00865 [Clostridium sp.]|nr:hypothetical protein [Clostridium sp.]
MKTIKFLSWMFVALITSFVMAGCSNDDDESQAGVTETVIDLSDAVSGVYSGKLSMGSEVVNDAYIVTITRVTSTAVHVKANFFGEDPVVFNVEKLGNQYVLTNTSNYNNVSMYVSNGTLNINYVNVLGAMMAYVGNK